jgi:hypothetical protein
MEFRVTSTMSTDGLDAADLERVVEAFLAVAADAGPVVGANLASGTLSVTIGVAADDLDQGKREIARIFTEGMSGSGLAPTEILDVELVDVDGGAALRRELALA